MEQSSYNLLVGLRNWAIGQEENFVTEAFAHLLRYLLEHEPLAGVELLKRLTSSKIVIAESDAAFVTVSTQTTVEEKRPDIEIKAPEWLVYIEVKVDAGLGKDQLKHYRDRLDRSGVALNCLVLLTRYLTPWPPGQKPDSVIRWYQVLDWLQEFLDIGTVEVEPGQYLVHQLVEFLKERKMSVERVGPDLTGGLRSMRGLVSMIWEAAISLGLKPRYVPTWDWVSLDLNNHKYYLGIWIDEPSRLRFRTWDVRIAEEQIGQEGFWMDKGRLRWENVIDLTSEEIGFFNMDKEDQIKCVEEFVRGSLSKAREIENASKANLPDS